MKRLAPYLLILPGGLWLLIFLVVPKNFEGFPLRKDFVLAARVAKAWPETKEPGESDHGSPSRRKTLPPGVPVDWGRDDGRGAR